MNMNEQSKGIKVLYAVFLLAITTSTVLALYDRFKLKDKDCDCKRMKEHENHT